MLCGSLAGAGCVRHLSNPTEAGNAGNRESLSRPTCTPPLVAIADEVGTEPPGRAVDADRYQPSFWARASYSSTAADTDTLSESAVPSIGTNTPLEPRLVPHLPDAVFLRA